MAPQKSSIIGEWRITEMELWDQDFVDAQMPGFIRFDPDGRGEFHFDYVHGHMTVEYSQEAGAPKAEWSWSGNDEMHEASGRGRAIVDADGVLNGKLVFHRGDASDFAAVRITIV